MSASQRHHRPTSPRTPDNTEAKGGARPLQPLEEASVGDGTLPSVQEHVARQTPAPRGYVPLKGPTGEASDPHGPKAVLSREHQRY